MPAPSTLRQVRVARLPAPGPNSASIRARTASSDTRPPPFWNTGSSAALACSASAAAMLKYSGGARPEQVPWAFHSWGAMIATSDILDCRSVWTVCGRFSDGRLPSRCPLGRPQNCSVDGCGHRPCRISVGPSLPTCPLRQPALDRSTVHRLGPHVTTSRLEVLFAATLEARSRGRSSTNTLKTTAATTTTPRAAEIDNTAASPRRMMHSSQQR